MPARFTPREMVGRLVSFDTTSRNSNLDLLAFVASYLEDHGVAAELFHNEARDKANLHAVLGPADRAGGVILSGHTDVVPVDGQDWSSNPFAVTEKDGRLYGRGTADMKSFIATALALVPDFLGHGLERPVHLALSYDEEVGCVGCHSMVDAIAARGPRPALAIVGEPTSMEVVDAHKGIRAFETLVRGREAHSSETDRGLNAVVVAARLIGFLDEIGREMRTRGDPSGRFDPPYTSVHVGTIRGGTALNIIPRECRFSWEFRALPGQDEDEIPDRFHAFVEEVVLPAMRERAPADAAVETKPGGHVPILEPEPGSEAERLVLRLAGRNRTRAVSYGTEAGIFQRAGIPAVVCGPGSILEAHRPDEFVEIAQIEACAVFMKRLMSEVGRG